MATLAMVFPGQGSQKVGMLTDLADRFEQVRDTFAEASEALGWDAWAVAQGEPAGQLDQTAYTQPVLLAASIALWRLWRSQGGIQPAFVAGHSLGEYSALVAAEALEFVDAVRLVHLRGQLMQEAVPIGAGAMAAVLGLDDRAVEALCAQSAGVVSPANYNAKGQVVIAGAREAVAEATAAIKSQGAKVMLLAVSAPSHCALMQPVREQLTEALHAVDWHQPRIPVVQNARAQVEPSISDIQTALSDQLEQPVRWTQSMAWLNQQGVTELVECGPSNVLTNLAKRLETPLLSFPIDTLERLHSALAPTKVELGF